MSYIESENLPIKGIVLTLALDSTLSTEFTRKSFGISELAELSYELLPDAQRRAFSTAQQVSEELKKKAAFTAITLASTASGAVGAIPIPIADALVLVPIQMTMFRGIANAFGLQFKDDDFANIVSVVAPVVAVQGGKAIVSGAVASSMTLALGTAFQKALEHRLNEMKIAGLNPDSVADILNGLLLVTL